MPPEQGGEGIPRPGPPRPERKSPAGGAEVDERRLAPEDWADAVAAAEGPQLAVAGPGAGKTEFLVRRAAHLIDEAGVPGPEILVLTFSRRAAADLRNRIGRAVSNPAGGLNVSTFHSFAYRLLEQYAPGALGWKAMPSVLTGPEQVELVSRLLASDPPGRWPPPFDRLLDTRTLAAEATEFILRSRERLLGPRRTAALCAEREAWSALPAFVARYDRELDRLGRIDYGTLLGKAVEVLGRRRVSEEAARQHRYLLVDEYQDTTLAQAALLRGLTRRRGNLTAAADPYQSIYAFRGADISNVAGFAADFRRPGGPPVRRWVLGASFRVPAEILRAAERLTSGASLPGAAGPVQPAPHPGRVDLHVFDQESEESEWIASEAARLHLEQGVPYHRMGVLVRTKRRLLRELSRALERRSIPHDRPDMRLADHQAARMIFDLAAAAAAPDRAAAAAPLRRLLLGPLFDLGVARLRRIERISLSSEAPWSEVVRREVEGGGGLARLLEDPSWTKLPAVEAFWRAWTGLPQFRTLALDPGRREFRAAWTSLAQTLARLGERDPSAALIDYMRLAESEDFEASPLLSYRNPAEDRMALTTLHQAKGLDFDAVFIADAVEGVLPDLRRRQTLLQTEEAGAPGPAGPGAQRRLQEETRLMYTAMTRARLRVSITATSAGFGGEHRRPSRFMNVISGGAPAPSPADSRKKPPITVREAEAWLRTILADPAQPGGRRLAAARVLASGGRLGLRPPGEYAAVRRPGADAGLPADGRRLSPTDAAGYDRCPREFVLQRVLRVSRADGPHLAFGSLVHDVLERAERRAMEEDRRSTLEEALAVLEEELPGRGLGGGAVGEAWGRRGAALLTRLYEGRPRPGAAPVLLEHDVEMELGGAVWRGRIDRIEQDPGGALRIVDYKTGRTPPSKKEGAGSLQLGFYALAAAEDESVGAFGQVEEAEFWHPLAAAPARRVTPYDPSRLEETRARLEEIAGGIAAEDWTPKPGKACGRCGVRLVCPAWPEGQEAYRR